MKVYLNCKWMGQEVTGTQRYARELTRRLQRRDGIEPILVIPSDAVVPEWAASFQLRQSRFRGILFEQVALPLISRRGLLINLGGPAPIFKLRQIVTMHDASFIRLPQTYSWKFVAWYKIMYRVLSRTAKQVITVSNFSARELASFVHVLPASMKVIPNGSDHMNDLKEREPALNLRDDEPFVLCVGTLAKHKNLIPTVAALNSAGIKVVVVGAAGSARVFNSEHGFSQGVVVAGRLDDEELKWLYVKATALVFPSLYEGFGLPVVEAQHCGCPVISSDRASLTEVGGTGSVYFAADNPLEAVQVFQRILKDDVYRTSLANAGIRNAARYTWDGSADLLSQLIQDTLQRMTRRRLSVNDKWARP